MGDSFVHLHVHTEYSMLDGASRVDALVQRAAELEMPALAITDHGVMFGAVDFYRACLRHGIKPIIGSEIYMAPESRWVKGTGASAAGAGGSPGAGGARAEPYHHLTLLAENQTGYRNLMKLVSRAYLEGYWYKPRADKELLAEHAEGLICLSGCLGGEVNQYLLKGKPDEAYEAAGWYREVFGQDRYFVEVQDHGIDEQRATNPRLMAIAERLGVGLVVANDSHYTDQADHEAHDVLLCIQTGAQKADANRFKFSGDQFFLKTAEQMHALFPEHPETWKNTLDIGDRCNVEISFGQHHLPRFDCPDGLSEEQYLRRCVLSGAEQRYGSPAPAEVVERLDYELGVIESMRFSAYFLIVADLCRHAREVGIRVGPGRGSAAGCAVAYCTGITDLDPIAHGLIFERFLNPERISMPDIDLDFDERRRGEMIRYATEKYGVDRVAQIVTFSTIKAKAAIKDAARVLGYPYSFGDKLTKMMPPPVMGKDYPLGKARELSGELRQAWESDAEARKVLDTALQLEGLRRQHSIHAAGVVIAGEEITEHCPVLRVEADGEIVTQYDGGMVEAIGLLKMDFLGLRNLTVISDALDHIARTTGERIVIEDIPLDDPKTYALLAEADTDGVFQLDSAGIKAVCKQLGPDTFDDIVALLALYRPGPMAAGLHTEYAKRKHGRSRVTYRHEDLGEILEGTYGLLIYQEQVQKIAQRIAGFSLGEADLIRKAIGKKKMDEMTKLKEQFISGCVGKGYDARLGKELWDEIEGFADYAFNKSHSAGYGLVSYQTAWLKANYPVEYMAALLTSVKNNKDRLPLYLHSCRMMGLVVLQPDVNASDVDFSPTGGSEIRFGLSAVRNVGEQVVAEIIRARTEQGPFGDFADFCKKVDAGVLNRRTVESLVKAGAFESLGHPRLGLLRVFEDVVDHALSSKRAEAEGQFSLFGEATGVEADAFDLVVPEVEFERKEKLAAEREMLGLYVSDHPLLGVERVLESLSTHSIADVAAGGVSTSTVTVAGILTGITKKFTKAGAPYVVGLLEDLKGGIEVIFFPQTYTDYGDLLSEDEVLCVSGRLDNGESPKLIASEVRAPDLADAASSPLTLSLAPRQCTPQVVQQLRTILAEHPGSVPVHLQLDRGNGAATSLRVGDDLSVRRDTQLYAELKELLGPAAVR